jgi:DNA replication initiation complex subunit (GINS family)
MLNSGKKNILTRVVRKKNSERLTTINQSLYETLRQNIKRMFIFE